MQSIILGAIQGITEFFPVSSTAHLVLLPWFFSWTDQGLPFNVALHMGSLIAIIYYFWRDWILIIKEFLQSVLKGSFEGRPNGKTGLYLVIATVPGALAGLLFEEYAAGLLRHPLSIAFSLSFFGVILYFSDRVSKKNKTVGEMNIVDCIIIGLSQALAIIPGVSRAGITITGAMFRNLNREEAAKFSFLLGAPLIAGAGVFEARHLEYSAVMSVPFIAGVLASAVFAFLAIKYLLRFVRKSSYTVFVIYRLGLAVLIVFLYLTR
ncbi:MAG: undecaprenyl-diphosphate phosphatase [Candidatus Dadabacteria bacterium]|nr:undecaprenyl-diphosphate phosphatase [Candidatus Dadabacteria bacterium]MCZ6555210.1 undecaprenyl-diphosphate phosphatase [Candidatus Dadabacteria bacterium]MCZ6685236.1 undecaprenyl-diphosphate phosphatase [Candidatus Dadabacteria bacterium]MCZ6790210.1 undecaprenyl-diphosphate phosphatase [Candidatus Dadabacteria bacterium]MCZ6864421.1 undecaprenyl-diphosphate phosphatase [Candidatus Dadabacteria bacterium]